MIIVLQIITSIILFFLINIIGKFAPTDLRYYQITSFLETDEAPAFNFSFRVLTPVVFIIIISSILYSFHLDYLVKDIYYVSIYYVLFRAIYNIAIARTHLINWKKQILYAICIIGLSFYMYEKVISTKKNLLPDFSNISNELWIIILIFMYNLLNNIETPNNGAEKRKLSYIKNTFTEFKTKYSEIIKSSSPNIRFEQISYSILIHENFNRPKLFRIIEYIKSLLFKKPGTFGVMQVRSKNRLNDKQSVEMGINILLENFKTLQSEFKEACEKEDDNYYNKPEYLDGDLQLKLIRNYNHCDDYCYEIKELADYINEKFYNNDKKSLKLFI
jgi:hypothetical protein